MDKYFAWFGLPGSLVLTTLLSITAIALAICFRTKDRKIAAFAMVCCSMGDIVLAGYFGLDELLGTGGFYVGAGIFIIGHLIYIAAYMVQIRTNNYTYKNKGFWCGIVFTAAVFLVITVYMVANGTFPGITMYGICILYACIIGADLSTIWSFSYSACSKKSFAALGVLVFFVSDLVIGIGRLCGINDFDVLIWWLYPIGQFVVILCA
ncbi:MAG TPA: hypothetical protein IAC14_09810 [Candidatus Scybalomonas excrementigallinarum]|nr:hypothetical protein [Candidatus Scybalomonas excrementigallinarum]